MSEPIASTLTSPADQTFPTLTPAQIARIAEHGTARPIRRGEVLVEAGDHGVPFFVVREGRLEVVRPAEATETLVATHGPGQFTGEVNLLSGRRALLRTRVSEDGEVIALDEKGFIKTGPDLSKDELNAARWPLARAPYLLETSLPGVFAVGDIRSGSVKRVASAVGEGSIAVSFVHRALQE